MFKPRGVFNNLISGGEERILAKSIKILKIGVEATNILKSKDNIKVKLEKIRNLEKLSDDIVFELSEMITSGGVAPNLIDDLLELIDKEDNIIDSLYNLTRELARYEIKEVDVKEKLNKNVERSISLANSAIQTLIKMETSKDLLKMGKYREEIEEIEENGDEIKDSLFDFAYNKNKINFKTFYHIFEIAHLCDDVLDNCEDTADSFIAIMNSIIS